MPNLLLANFNFEISLLKSAEIESGSNLVTGGDTSSEGRDSLGDGGFQECSGLEIEMDVQQHQEGGRNDGVIQQVGRAKYQNLVLKRGMFFGDDNQVARDLWEWLQGIVSGQRPVVRYDGIVKVKGRRPAEAGGAAPIVATWVFDRALPIKIRGPELNAKTGDIAIEELHIAHEGLRLTVS